MNTNSNSYTIIYASVLVIIVAFLLAFVNSSLRELQGKNVELDTKKQILSSLGIRDVQNPEAKFAEVVKEDMLVAEDGSLKPYEGAFVTGYEKAYKEKGEAHLFVCEVDGEKVTLEEALKAKKYGKIYFQIGINEMGRGTLDGFMTAYEDSVEKFRELQPDAVIFVQGIMKVAKEKSDKDPIFNNVGIEQRNERIAALADGKNIFYLDMNEVVCDEEGNLKSSLTFDDIHLYGSKYGIWVDYLKENGI